MSAVAETVRPTNLEQIQTSIKGWFEGVFKGTEIPIRFSHSTEFPNRLCLVPTRTPGFKVEIDQRTIMLQVKRHRLLVFVDDFDVRTELQDKKICFQIEPHPKPENRFLGLALRELAETKHPALVSRLLRVVTNLEKELPKGRINEAVAAPTDYLVFLNAISASSLTSEAAAEDPLAAAKFRGLERKRQLLEAARCPQRTGRCRAVENYASGSRQATRPEPTRCSDAGQARIHVSVVSIRRWKDLARTRRGAPGVEVLRSMDAIGFLCERK